MVFHARIYGKHWYPVNVGEDWFGDLKVKSKVGTIPLLPNLKRSKFHTPYEGNRTTYTPTIFCQLFLTDVKLTHLALSFACRASYPYLGYSEETTLNIYRERCHLLFERALRDWPSESLQVYVAGDELRAPFDGIITGCGRCSLRLLVFKCLRLDCLALPTSIYGTRLMHTDSAWDHIWAQYTWFQNCDCILLETAPGGGIPEIKDPSWWRKPSECILREDWPETLSLRYFIVGYKVDGYQGMNETWTFRWTKCMGGWMYC